MDYQKIVEEIKEKVDIVDFIGEFIDLKKTGQNYRALCPFHSEKTPSFFVSPSKKIWHCFGCGKGGDVLTFLMEYENVDFHEALSILAKRAGIHFSPSQKTLSPVSKEKLYEIYKIAALFYSDQLKKSQKAKNYVLSRGINESSIELFAIGYAPDEKDALYNYLKMLNFDDNLIKRSALILNNYDFFRDRIIIPIHDATGRIIGFGGRLIEQKSELPKYINSPDTTIFKKGENLFGFWQAKKFIKEKGYSIIVEGYMDVILCHQYGFKNAVAPLGTAVTLEQLRKIKRITNKLLFLFDGDEAGITAAERSLVPAFQLGFIVKIALLKENEDPASILQREGANSLRNYIARAFSPVELFIEKRKKKNLTERIHDFLSIIGYLKDSIYIDQLLKELSEKTDISEMSLRDELKKVRTEAKQNKEMSSSSKEILLNEEEFLLRLTLAHPEKINYILQFISIEDFENNLVKNLILKIKELYEDGKYSLDKFLNLLDQNEKGFISKLIMISEIEENSLEKHITDCIKRLSIKTVDKKIKEAAKLGDEKSLYELIRKKKILLERDNERE